MNKVALIFLAVLAILGGLGLSYVSQGFMEAARHGGSVAARERRLAAISKQQNVALPKNYGNDTVMVATTAGPGLRFTYIFKILNVTSNQAIAAKLAATGKANLIEKYKTLPELDNFRKWEVELRWQYLDKDGKEITTVTAKPQEL
jgi:hypothetical protein